VHVHADLFTAIEIYAVKVASTTVFLLFLFRYVKREFKRDD
jgi:hypothetical protein